MIFFAVAGPTPGRSSSSFSEAELRSILAAGVAVGLLCAVTAAGKAPVRTASVSATITSHHAVGVRNVLMVCSFRPSTRSVGSRSQAPGLPRSAPVVHVPADRGHDHAEAADPVWGHRAGIAVERAEVGPLADLERAECAFLELRVGRALRVRAQGVEHADALAGHI